jgi:tRNA pseudouridine55 synthase
VLVIDKPSGPSSHDVVARARRVLDTPRVGHTGTLDPLATGVLPLVVGSATRLAQYLTAAEKSYSAVVRLGAATDTYDALGRIVPMASPRAVDSIARAEIEVALDAFRGTFLQVPPPYSAKKVGGVRSYKLARRARTQDVEPGFSRGRPGLKPSATEQVPSPATVHVRHLGLVAMEGSLLDLRIVSSAGFYVRSLAHDLGARLGCGAHLEGLRRTRSGDFDESMALPLAALESPDFRAENRIVPTGRLLMNLPAVVLNERGTQRATHGAPLGPGDLQDAGDLAAVHRHHVRLLTEDGGLLGIARTADDPAADGGASRWLLHPVTVLV